MEFKDLLQNVEELASGACDMHGSYDVLCSRLPKKIRTEKSETLAKLKALFYHLEDDMNEVCELLSEVIEGNRGK